MGIQLEGMEEPFRVGNAAAGIAEANRHPEASRRAFTVSSFRSCSSMARSLFLVRLRKTCIRLCRSAHTAGRSSSISHRLVIPPSRSEDSITMRSSSSSG